VSRPDRPHEPQPDTPPAPNGTLASVEPDLTWHKSSRCGNSTCVEIARDGNDYLIRDSKNPDQPALRFSSAEWSAFVAGVEAGEFRFQ
jgi:predicted secreted Zn-dependent protease